MDNWSFGLRQQNKTELPIPLENMNSNGTTFQSLLEVDFEDIEFTDIDKISPSDRGLLTYIYHAGEQGKTATIDCNFVDTLLQAGANVSATDRYGQTVLHAVAKDWDTNVAEFLIKRGVDVNHRDRFGRTPLHVAANFNYPSMIKLLVASGANLEEKTEGELLTPLLLACKKDSLSSVKELLRLGANLNAKDHVGRTPLCVGADWGCTQVVKYLLRYGAPAGAFNDYGSLPLSSMVNKMPDVAEEALEQFTLTDTTLRQTSYYLYTLDACVTNVRHNVETKNILQLIVIYGKLDLVSTTAIKKLIDVKWKLFGYKHATFSLVLNLIYSILWTSLAIWTPRSGEFYRPINKYFWRTIIDTTLTLLTIYFIFKQVKSMVLTRRTFLSWKNMKLSRIETEIQYSHPGYSDERRLLMNELNTIRELNRGGIFSSMWTLIEVFFLSGVIALIACNAAYQTVHKRGDNKEIEKYLRTSYDIISFILLFTVWVRLMKEFRSFSFLASFITLLGHVAGETVKFVVLFMDIYIPYVCIFFIFFGGESNKEKIVKAGGSGKEFSIIPETFMTVWSITLVADFPYEGLVAINEYMAQIIVGSYWAIASLICVNLYIALMSETFSRVYSNAKANSILQLATMITEIEQSLSDSTKAKLKKYFSEHCSPLRTFRLPPRKSDDDDPVAEGINQLSRDVKKIKDRIYGPLTDITGVIKDNKVQIETLNERIAVAAQTLEHITEKQKEIQQQIGEPALKQAGEKFVGMFRKYSVSNKSSRVLGGMKRSASYTREYQRGFYRQNPETASLPPNGYSSRVLNKE